MRKKQREEEGETMTEERKNQPVSTAQTQPVSTAQTAEKPVVDKNTLVEAFVEAQQK